MAALLFVAQLVSFAKAFSLNPSTPPGKVIEQQLKALQDGDIGTVYKFASPGNKLQTGDVTNFSRMVRSGPYRYVNQKTIGFYRQYFNLSMVVGLSSLINLCFCFGDRYLVGHTRSEILLESKMAESLQFLVRVTSSSDTASSSPLDLNQDNNNDEEGESGVQESAAQKKVLEYWWSLSRCRTGEFTGSYMVDAVIPNQM